MMEQKVDNRESGGLAESQTTAQQPAAQPDSKPAPPAPSDGTTGEGDGEQLLAGKFRDQKALEQGYLELQKKLGARGDNPQDEGLQPDDDYDEFDYSTLWSDPASSPDDEQPDPDDEQPYPDGGPYYEDPYGQGYQPAPPGYQPDPNVPPGYQPGYPGQQPQPMPELEALVAGDVKRYNQLVEARVSDLVDQRLNRFMGARDRVEEDRRRAEQVYGRDVVDTHDGAAMDIMRKSGGTVPYGAAMRMVTEKIRMANAEQRGYARAVALAEQKGVDALISRKPSDAPAPAGDRYVEAVFGPDERGPEDGNYEGL